MTTHNREIQRVLGKQGGESGAAAASAGQFDPMGVENVTMTASQEMPPNFQTQPISQPTTIVYDAYDLYLQGLASMDGMPEAPSPD